MVNSIEQLLMKRTPLQTRKKLNNLPGQNLANSLCILFVQSQHLLSFHHCHKLLKRKCSVKDVKKDIRLLCNLTHHHLCRLSWSCQISPHWTVYWPSSWQRWIQPWWFFHHRSCHSLKQLHQCLLLLSQILPLNADIKNFLFFARSSDMFCFVLVFMCKCG